MARLCSPRNRSVLQREPNYCGSLLSCPSSHPHQVTGVYPLGTTCATAGTATTFSSASYDAFGNLSSRTSGNVTATLSSDLFNRLVSWSTSTQGSEQYVYDTTGQRVLKRSTNGGGSTTLSVYPLGLEEYDYSGSGTLSSQIHYYTLAGHLLGESNGSSTVYHLTDALGSIL